MGINRIQVIDLILHYNVLNLPVNCAAILKITLNCFLVIVFFSFLGKDEKRKVNSKKEESK